MYLSILTRLELMLYTVCMPTKKKKKLPSSESDSTYFLKLVLYVALGAVWLRFNQPISIGHDQQLYGLPIGLLIGLVLASHDHFQIDRKIEYAILIILTIIGFIAPYLGIFI